MLPLHHPIRVAEQWATLDLLSSGRVDFAAGRGYDRREYEPFQVDFDDNQAIFEEGMEIVQRLWAADGRSRITASITSSTTSGSRRSRCSGRSRLCRVLLEAFDRAGGAAGLRPFVAPFAAAMTLAGCKQVAELYHETCAGMARNRAG